MILYTQVKRTGKILFSDRIAFLVFCFLAVLTIINQVHFFYPDEFENILGGYYILHGKLPYTGFFTHHNPFAYFFASPIALLAGQSFVKFRLLLGVVYIGAMIGFYIFAKKRLGADLGKMLLVWFVFITMGATYWWGQMLLADTLSGYLIFVPVFLLFWIVWRKEALQRADLWIISVFSAITILTTFTLSYAVAVIYLFSFIWYFRQGKVKLLSRQTLKLLAIFVAPYLVFTAYLLLTGSISEYFYQSIWFNGKYYVTFPGGVSATNPLRVAVVLFSQFFQNYKTALAMVKDLNFGSPFFQTLALANTVLVVYLAMERRFFLALFITSVVIYSIVRSNPYTTAETDYQGMTYHLLSVFSGLTALWFLWQRLKSQKLEESKKVIYHILMVLLGAYFFFFGLHLFEKAFDKAYQKYMGTQALIYDRPSVASTLNSLISREDYYFIGPFDFENHLYMNAKLPSKYIVVLPAMDRSEKIQRELLDDLQKNKPDVLVYDTEFRIFHDKPGAFLQKFIADNYFNLEELGAPCTNYKASTKWFGSYDFERHFFFTRDKKEEMLKKLFEKNLASNVDPNNVPEFCRLRQKSN